MINYIYTLWLFNIAMERSTMFKNGKPSKNQGKVLPPNSESKALRSGSQLRVRVFNMGDTGWVPQDSVQLTYEWLNSMVYGRYNNR